MMLTRTVKGTDRDWVYGKSLSNSNSVWIDQLVQCYFNDYFLDLNHGIKWDSYIGQRLTDDSLDMLRQELKQFITSQGATLSSIEVMSDNNNNIQVMINGEVYRAF